ncbi:Crp/Fnr family transcriptional regulator [Flavobacterium sp. J27]|uniref:Crp/Fnr family transcriptional regulator n=1 Tax=Flavobacterium sp. J27 TaxID=2060419 RepID=UPI00102F5A2F|nr:Crp/Fnr family transcriptional regulator [Flavobacterium sp. J27]
MNTQPIIDHLTSYLPLKEEEIKELETKLLERNIKRKQFILQEGDICKHYTFVVKGCFKMYKVDKNGNEHNLQFTIENGWIGDLGSFYSNKPSELYIEAMESSIILQIEKKNLLHLYTNYLVFNRIFRVLVENAFIRLQKRVLQNISSTAEERYVDFIENYPSLFNRISNVQIASFLGVTPEFLSKIRKDLTSKI